MIQNVYWQELKGTLKLGVPLILAQLLGYAQQVIDTVMAGQHNELTLASVSLAGQLFTTVYLLMVGIGVAISASISRYHGREDRIRIRRSFQQAMWLMTFLGALTYLLITLSAFIPNLIGSEENIAREARKYLLTLAPGGALFVFSFSARFFLEGMSYPRTNIIIQLSMLPLNVFFNWAFLSGWWIFPALGAQGMAIATAICYTLYTLLVFHQLFHDPRWRSLRLFKKFAPPYLVQLKAYLRIGIPISLAIVMEALLFISIGLIVSRSNAIITGANQIAQNYSGMMFMIPLGISSALTIRVSNALGRNDMATARVRSIVGIILAACIMVVSGLLIVSFSTQIAGFYSDNAEVIHIAANILIVIAVFQVFDGTLIAAAGVLRGMQDTKVAMIYALIGYWILGFPLGLLLAYIIGYGIYGLWAGVAIGLFINSILSTRRVLKKTAPVATPTMA